MGSYKANFTLMLAWELRYLDKWIPDSESPMVSQLVVLLRRELGRIEDFLWTGDLGLCEVEEGGEIGGF